MLWKVLEYDATKENGVISGDDGNKYSFDPKKLKSESTPKAGSRVDFQPSGDSATAIYIEQGASVFSKRLIAGLFGIILGVFGVHKFFLGFIKQGVIMLVISLLGFILLGLPTSIIALIGLIEGIIYLARSNEDFEQNYIQGNKGWF